MSKQLKLKNVEGTECHKLERQPSTLCLVFSYTEKMYISIDIILRNDRWTSANIWFALYRQLNKFLNASTKNKFQRSCERL